MPSITGGDLTTIRTAPARVKRYASFAPLTAVFTCQVNGSASVDSATGGVYAFQFDNSSGSTSDVSKDATVWIGTTAGARDIGVTRVRKAISGSTFYIAETSWGKLRVADNHYVTVFRDFRPWSKAPRLVGVKNKSNFINSFTEYHDYDEAYTNQNSQIKPKANITRSATDRSAVKPAGFVDAGQTYRTVVLSSAFSAAIAPSATIASRSWYVDDGTITVGVPTDTTITVTFPATKTFRWINLQVTDSNGKIDTMWWPIWVHDANNMPRTNFSVTSDSRGAGREMAFEFFGADDSADETVIPEGSIVCYWEEATFGGSAAPNQYIDQFLGWTMEDSVTLRYNNRSRYAITVGGVQSWLSRFNGYAQKVSNKTPINRWYKMGSITVDRIMHYVLREYSTALNVCNLFLSGITTTVMAEEFKKSDIWSQITELQRGNTFCNTVCDSLGSIWVRRAYEYLGQVGSLSDRAAVSIIVNLTASDLTDSRALQLSYDKLDRVSVVSLNGSYVVSNKNYLVYSKAPALVPAMSGGDEEGPFQRLPSTGQTELNRLSGNHYAKVNEPLRSVDLELIGNLDIFERAWGEPITVTWTNDNIRGTIVNTQEFIIDNISVAHSNEFGTVPKRITLTVSKATIGYPGVSYFPPKSNAKFSIPTIKFPKIDWPVFQPFEWYGVNLPPSVPTAALFVESTNTSTDRVYISNQTFDKGEPTWSQEALSIGNDVTTAVCADPFSPLYLGTGTTVNCYMLTADYIIRITDLFGARVLNVQETHVNTVETEIAANIEYSKTISGWLIATMYDITTSTVKVKYTTDGGITWNTSASAVSGADYLKLSNKTPGRAFIVDGAYLYRSDDYGATWSIVSDISVSTGCRYIHCPEHNNPNDLTWIVVNDGNVVFSPGLVPANDTNFMYLHRNYTEAFSTAGDNRLAWPSPDIYAIIAMETCDTDRNRLGVIGYPYWRAAAPAVAPIETYFSGSQNFGRTWSPDIGVGNSRGFKISPTNPDFLYFYGSQASETGSMPAGGWGFVAISRDFGKSRIELRRGNLGSFNSPVVMPVTQIIGG